MNWRYRLHRLTRVPGQEVPQLLIRYTALYHLISSLFMYNFPFVQYSACLSFCVSSSLLAQLCMCLCIYACCMLYVCMYVCMCWVCVCVYVCMYVCVCMRSCYAMLCYAMLWCYCLLWIDSSRCMHTCIYLYDIQVGTGGWIFIYNTYLSLLLRI